jgi:hypothetical protein
MQLTIRGSERIIKATKAEILKLRAAADVVAAYVQMEPKQVDVAKAGEELIWLARHLEGVEGSTETKAGEKKGA